MDRRRFIGVSSMLFATSLANKAAIAHANYDLGAVAVHESSDEYEVEHLRGDPKLPTELLEFDPLAIQQLVLGKSKAAYSPRIENFGVELVSIASSFIGMNREKNEGEITKFLNLFDLPFKDKNGNPFAYCAAGVSYAAALVYAKSYLQGKSDLASLRSCLGDIDFHHFYATPSVMDMKYVAMGKRRWLSHSDAVRRGVTPEIGWLVIYNWDGDARSDHVGLVERVSGGDLHSIEFNTSLTIAGSQSNGGAVARRVRPYDSRIDGFIRSDLKRIV